MLTYYMIVVNQINWVCTLIKALTCGYLKGYQMQAKN